MDTIAFWHRLWACLTAAFALSFAVGSVLDLIAYRKAGNDATFSWWFADLCRDWLIIPFVMGAVVAHWFAPLMRRLSETPLGDLLAEVRRRPPTDGEAGTTTTTTVQVTQSETTTTVPDDDWDHPVDGILVPAKPRPTLPALPGPGHLAGRSPRDPGPPS